MHICKKRYNLAFPLLVKNAITTKTVLIQNLLPPTNENPFFSNVSQLKIYIFPRLRSSSSTLEMDLGPSPGKSFSQ